MYAIENQIHIHKNGIDVLMERRKTLGDVERYEKEILALYEKMGILREQLCLAKEQVAARESIQAEIEKFMKTIKEYIGDDFAEYDDTIVRQLEGVHKGNAGYNDRCYIKVVHWQEKVKAHSCAFSELLRECFANVKDNVFHYRLQIASERVSELKICFLNPGHRTRFYEGCALTRCKDASFIAQLFLLSTSDVLYSDQVEYSEMDLKSISENDYLCYSAAIDMRHDSSHRTKSLS